MATTPDVTQLTAASIDANGFMQAIYDHITGTSTKFQVTNDNGATTAFTIEPTSASSDIDFQLNLRNNSATNEIVALLDPTSSISNAGNASTAPTVGNSSQASSEVIGLDIVSGDHSQNFYSVEVDDAICFLGMDDTESTTELGIFAGRKIIPPSTSLGEHAIMGGKPLNADGSGTTGFKDWGSDNTEYQFDSQEFIQTAETANTGNGFVPQPAKFHRAGALPNMILANGDAGAGSRPLGFFKYLVATDNEHPVGTLVDGGSGETSFVIIGDSVEDPTKLAMIWDRNVTPLFQ